MKHPHILLIVGGGIAAYKSCELVRTIRKGGGKVTCVLTEGGAKFVTPMALAALSENPVYTSLWDLKNEVEMGHIQLSREADLIVVCPATANLMAKMAAGIADDLATTVMLATNKPVLAVPAMNVRMWDNPATQRNVETLRASGIEVMEPDSGAMACGEFGPGRLPEPDGIWQRIAQVLEINPGDGAFLADTTALGEYEDDGAGGLSASLIARGKQAAREALGLSNDAGDDALAVDPASGPILSRKGQARAAPPTDPEAINHLVTGREDAAPQPFANEASGLFPSVGGSVSAEPRAWFTVDPNHQPLAGKHVLVTAGPTHEPIDPVRYIANRSSGKQGYAIAAAVAALGARVTLISGPVNLQTPPGVDRVDVETAIQMGEAVKKTLPVDIAVMVAAVADWRTSNTSGEKIKKRGSAPPALMLTENPDILASLGQSPDRPPLLIGFAAETTDVIQYASEKLKRKGADWIVANDVSGDVMGGQLNTVHIISNKGVDSLPEMPKEDVAMALAERIAEAINE